MKTSLTCDVLYVVGNKTLSKCWSSLSLKAFHFLRSQTKLHFDAAVANVWRADFLGCSLQILRCSTTIDMAPWVLLSGNDPDRGQRGHVHIQRWTHVWNKHIDAHACSFSLSRTHTHNHHGNLNSKPVCKQIFDVMGLFSVQTISC